MQSQPIVPASTAVDRSSPEYDCTACGVRGPAAVVAFPGDGGSPHVLCADCARDREHLRALVRAVGVRAMVEHDVPRAGHAA